MSRGALPIVGAVGGAFAAVAALVVACGDPQMAARGASCNLASDCLPGLVCIQQRDGRRICDNDLSGIERPYDAAAPDLDAAAEDGEIEGGNDATVDAPAQQDVTTDTITPPPDALPDVPTVDAPPEAEPPDSAPDAPADTSVD